MELVHVSVRRLTALHGRQIRCGRLARSWSGRHDCSRHFSDFSNNASHSSQSSDAEVHQAFPLSGYYKLILDNPLTPSTHPAYSPSLPQTKSKATTSSSDAAKKKKADSKSAASGNIYLTDKEKEQFERQAELEKGELKELESRARIVFGSRLTGPQRREVMNRKAEYIAGVLVPPKPEEPDNCCMSGCVNCVWDLYREDMEYWVSARIKAREAARKQSMTKDTTSAEEDSGRFLGEEMTMLSDNYKDIPVGIRAFMETEKRLKQRRAQSASG